MCIACFHFLAALVCLVWPVTHFALFSFLSGPACLPIVATHSLAALRLSAYSQLEYVTAAMLARHVRPGGARVLQVCRRTRLLR